MLENIILVIDAAHINGGAAKVALSSAVGLSQRGYHVVVLSSIMPIDRRLEENGVRVVCTGQPDILSNPSRLSAAILGVWNFKAYKTFKRILTDYPPENTVIHFHEWSKALSASVWSAVKGRNYRIVVTLHEYFLFCPNGGLYHYKQNRICHLKASSPTCYLCNCDARNYPQKLWRDIRQVVQNHIIRNCHDLHFIYISELNRSACFPYLKDMAANWFYLRNPIDLNESLWIDITRNDTYLFVGRISTEKGIRLFCQAITELGLKGCVLGDGPLKAEMEHTYPHIKFVGWVTGERKDQEIRKGKALVFPSLWYEGAPLTIVEMKSYGLPCIVPDRCAASEEIQDGKSGFIFKSGNLDSLKEAILKLERCNIQTLQSEIRSHFDSSLYSLETHCEGLQKIYSQVMSNQQE